MPAVRPQSPPASRVSSDRVAAVRSAGFTLVEMLTTMSVLAVMLTIATPGLASLVAANALSSAQGELTSAIVLARTEALKRATQVGVAAVAPVRGAEFSGGWVVFVDANGNGLYDPGETVVRSQAALRSNVVVSTSTGATAIVFNGRGFVTPFASVVFAVCSSTASKSYQVLLEPVGLADVAETTGCP